MHNPIIKIREEFVDADCQCSEELVGEAVS
jgi:hypothetical protein